MRVGTPLLLLVVAGCGRLSFEQSPLLADADPDALALANQYAAELLLDNPLAYWRFEAPDLALDWSGNGNHGLFRGETSPDTGAFGTGLRFGAMGRMDVSSTFRFNDRAPFSVECWLFLPVLDPDWQLLFSTDWWDAGGRQGYTVEFRDTNILFLRRRDSVELYAAGWGTLTAASWHHIVGTYDGTETRLYVDGAMRDVMSSALAISTPGNVTLSISEYTYTIKGAVDECAVYGTALAEPRVAAHFAIRMP